jgi:hypothetical protein
VAWTASRDRDPPCSERRWIFTGRGLDFRRRAKLIGAREGHLDPEIARRVPSAAAAPSLMRASALVSYRRNERHGRQDAARTQISAKIEGRGGVGHLDRRRQTGSFRERLDLSHATLLALELALTDHGHIAPQVLSQA